jgi:hypothetical protein
MPLALPPRHPLTLRPPPNTGSSTRPSPTPFAPPTHTPAHTQDLGLLPEEGCPPDGADSWVMSAYLLRTPHTRQQKEAGWEPPWLCETQARLAGGGGAQGCGWLGSDLAAQQAWWGAV